MKIGIDIRALAHRQMSGIGNYLYHALASILAVDTVNQYYLFSSGWDKSKYDWLPFRQPNVSRVHLRMPNKILNLLLSWPGAYDIFKKIPVALDLFWLPNINFFQTKTNTPYVLTIHDLSFLHNRRFYSWKIVWWHKMTNLRRLIDQASMIVVISENTKRDLIRFFSVPDVKIRKIVPGVSTRDMDRGRARELTKNLALPEKYFIFVGTLEPRKNVTGIIQAFDIFYRERPEYRLVIAGGLGWLYKPILKLIKSRPYIRYLGYVDSPLKEALYSLSQGLIWPSFYEGYGFPPLEALSQGVPVITSFKTSLPETLTDHVIYVDPYNVADIYQAMLVLSRDKHLASILGTADLSISWPRWPEQSKRIIDLFSEMYSHENSFRS